MSASSGFQQITCQLLAVTLVALMVASLRCTGQDLPTVFTYVYLLVQVINSFLHRFTGMPMEKIEKESDRDNFLSPVVAKDFGLIDSVIGGGLTAETRQKLHAGVALAA